MNTHIDHIDPSWEEGRDYQLVCGLDVVYNMEERDASLNIRKSNRFLPWRWCRDEIGEVPVNPGDLCLFLDPDTNEWVLEEFMGTWWYKKTNKTMGRYQPEVIAKWLTTERQQRAGRAGGLTAKKSGQLQSASKKGGLVRRRAVRLLHTVTGETHDYPSLSHAADAINGCHSALSKVARGIWKSYRKWQVEFI